MRRLLADHWYWPFISQFADNRYRPLYNRYWPIIGRGRLSADYHPNCAVLMCHSATYIMHSVKENIHD